MKAISIGKRYEIYEDSLKAYDKLPANTYTIRFAEMSGFYLELRSNLSVKEKVYGIHPEKADKVLRSFSTFERNLGVILSGAKGIGKSLFARLLASKAQDAGYPIIIVDQFIPGIAAYIESIEQEAVFLFDEFDKTFAGVRPGVNKADPQTELLSMFDGTSEGKKLFIITCNELSKLNDFLVNRPGRFHYHFRFGYPGTEDVQDYLNDKLDATYRCEIPKVVLFSQKVALNYDCLRAITFELNMGLPFEKAIRDLNIINIAHEQYDVTLHYCGGMTLDAWGVGLDLFNPEQMESVCLEDREARSIACVEFDPNKIIYDESRHISLIPAEDIVLQYSDYYEAPIVDQFRKLSPEYLSIIRIGERELHYRTTGQSRKTMGIPRKSYYDKEREIPF